MNRATIHAPAKLNLFLAITGRRTDGFHDLVSLVAPLEFGDTLTVERREAAGFELTCDDPAVPTDDGNLVLKAARAFAAATGWPGGAKFILEKRIPMGAGLGGGSSDGVAALRALNRLADEPLSPPALAGVAAQLGSDCPLFLAGGPAVMRGRGERVESLPPQVAGRLRGRRVLVFKPAFGIPTPWAYGRLAADAPRSYLPAAEAEARLEALLGAAAFDQHLLNTMEPPAFAKYVALPVMLDRLRREYGLAPRMSGSGSACFAFVPDEAPWDEIATTIRQGWGESAFVAATRLA